MERHEWQLEYNDTDLEIRSPDEVAELRVRPYECTPSPTLSDLHSLTLQLPNSQGRPVSEVAVGQFFGYMFDVIDLADNLLIRQYVVSLAEIMLDVTFICPSDSQGEYLQQVQPILDSCRDSRP